MSKFTKAVLTVIALISLSGCQNEQEMFASKALYDQVCRNVITDVSRYPQSIEFLETSVFFEPISNKKASEYFDAEMYSLVKSFNRTEESFTQVSVSYRLLENGRSNRWACYFHGLQKRGHMQMSTFFDGTREYNTTDEYYFFKSGATHADVFGFIKPNDLSTLEKLKIWVYSLAE